TCMKQGCQDPPGFINLSSRYGRRVMEMSRSCKGVLFAEALSILVSFPTGGSRISQEVVAEHG
ncbi:hypothetical protein CEP51_014360, partial [Fusarium floridanum]